MLEHKRPTPPISIHSPRMGRDNRERASPTRTADFNPLSPHGERPSPAYQAGAGMDFNPLSPHGERLLRSSLLLLHRLFQSTLPAWGETYGAICDHTSKGNFNPLSPHGERQFCHMSSGQERHISIHSPRMGRDRSGTPPSIRRSYFNPLSPHGERRCGRIAQKGRMPFQSTLPAWGETPSSVFPLCHTTISIHSPRMGRDNIKALAHAAAAISIHSPRMGRDCCCCCMVAYG